jgi:DNA-binding MarR family transcriptional regulator
VADRRFAIVSLLTIAEDSASPRLATRAADFPKPCGTPRASRGLHAYDHGLAPERPPMNAIFFGVKRAFHSTLRVARPLLSSLGLTAARFDLLYAVYSETSFRILQSRLRRTLGVTAPTVSRMLASLEELGLVRRSRFAFDARQRLVELTNQGLAALRRAIEETMGSGVVQLAVDSALAESRWHNDWHCLEQMDIAESVMRRLRSAFRDVGCVVYLWHPDQ